MRLSELPAKWREIADRWNEAGSHRRDIANHHVAVGRTAAIRECASELEAAIAEARGDGWVSIEAIPESWKDGRKLMVHGRLYRGGRSRLDPPDWHKAEWHYGVHLMHPGWLYIAPGYTTSVENVTYARIILPPPCA